MTSTETFWSKRPHQYVFAVLAALFASLVLSFLVFWAVAYMRRLPVPASAAIQTLITMSEAGEPLDSRLGLPNTSLTSGDLPLALIYVYTNPNRSSYDLLLGIRRLDLVTYSKIPKAIKSNILVGTLCTSTWGDDWGDAEFDFWFAEAGTALLDVGELALPALFLALEDASPLDSCDGETEDQFMTIQWRRKDIAYKYINLILSRKRFYSPDPKARDDAIEQLKKERDHIIRPYRTEP
jgi:hypothetical protein